MKQLFLFLLLACCVGSLQAQLFESRYDIIREKGYDYESGTANDGTPYISYTKRGHSETSGYYDYVRTYYFKQMNGEPQICFMWVILEPVSELNNNVKMLRKQFVEVGYMKWKDYENNVIYDLYSKDGVSVLKVYFDTEGR